MPTSTRPRRYSSNAHPGQANSPLDTTANRWLKARIRLVRKGMFTRLIPEVYIEDGPVTVDPATGVPHCAEGKWVRLRHARTGRPAESVVLTGLPGGKGRLKRALDVWRALFHARALEPEIVEENAKASVTG